MTEEMYKEQLERQYLDLNNIDKFVVNNYDKFLRGLCLDNIIMEGNIKNYSKTGIIKNLNYICTSKRMRINTYRKIVNNNDEYIPDKTVITVYKIKPKEQIPDLYNIIEYIKGNNINIEELVKNNNENNADEKETEEEDIITKNEMLFRYGVKTKWLKQLGINISREFFYCWFRKKTVKCNSEYGKTLQEKYKKLGIKEEIFAEDFRKKKITLYYILRLP